MEMINCKKKKMMPLTKEQHKSYENAKFVEQYISREKNENKYVKDKML